MYCNSEIVKRHRAIGIDVGIRLDGEDCLTIAGNP